MKLESTSKSQTKPGQKSSQIIAAFAVAAVLVAGGLAFERLSITTQITHFLPEGQSTIETAFSAALTKSQLVRTIILSVKAKDKTSAAKATKQMTAQLKSHPEIQRIESGISDKLTAEIKKLYFDRNLYFLSDQPNSELTQQLSPAGLLTAVKELKRQLRLPSSGLMRGLMTRDPFLAFVKRIEAFESASSGALEIVDGQLVTKNEPYGIIFIVTRHSPFRSTKSTLLPEIESAFQRAKDLGALELEQSSVHRFAAASEKSIRADISRISVFSILGITILFLILFGNIRYLLLAFVPILVGLASATIAVSLIFSSVHGITLAFGASMIGVCVDYLVHLYNHYELSSPPIQRSDSIKAIWPSLRLGAFTTVAGLVGLLFTDLPGTQEIAVFASVGVLGALYTTKYVLPLFLRQKVKPTSLQRKLARFLGRQLESLQSNRWQAILIWLPCLLVIIIGLPRLSWDNSLNALNHVDAALLAEDNRVRARVFRMENSVIIAALGDDEEQALQANDKLYPVLEASKNISAFRSLHSFLWSQKLQRENLQQIKSSPDLEKNFNAALKTEGFRAEAFGEAFSFQDIPPPLRYDDLLNSSLASTMQPFRLALGERVAFLNFVHDIQDRDGLEEELRTMKDVFVFDQHRFLSESYGAYRRNTLQVLPWGLLAVLLLLFWRFRAIRETLCAFIPAIVAAAASLGTLGILGISASLLHLVALLLILCIGVDYGVFITEHRHAGHARAATLLSIFVAALTTILSFGVLAMSESPALSALGLSIGVGVVFAVMLAPTALVFFEEA